MATLSHLGLRFFLLSTIFGVWGYIYVKEVAKGVGQEERELPKHPFQLSAALSQVCHKVSSG